MKIAATFGFEAAHRLPKLPDWHKCKNLHGHNYQLEVAVEGGDDLDERGFVMDYAELEGIVNPLVATVDHKYLNEIPGLDNPTSEIIVQWFMRNIRPALSGCYVVTLRLYETPRYWVELTE